MSAANKTPELPQSTPRPSLWAASVFKGETWRAYRPGEDRNLTFKAQWVSRTEQGALCSVLNSRKDLVANAKMCKVKLKWQNDKVSRATNPDNPMPKTTHENPNSPSARPSGSVPHPGVWCCERRGHCKWKGYALEAGGLEWGTPDQTTDEWQKWHQRECGGRLIQLLPPNTERTDQALLDNIQGRASAIVDKLDALDQLTPPVAPAAAPAK